MKDKVKIGNGWPYDVTKKDLEVTFCRSQGKGGQNVNKTNSACRMKHIPTGIQVFSQEHRTAELNKKESWKKLTKILVPMMKELLRENKDLEISKEQIRSYHEKRNTVSDKRVDRVFDYNSTLSGDLDPIIHEINLNRKS